MDVFIDEVDEEGVIGCSKGDVLEIDGCVYFNGDIDLKFGEIVFVLIEYLDEYDFWGLCLVVF